MGKRVVLERKNIYISRDESEVEAKKKDGWRVVTAEEQEKTGLFKKKGK
jgi:hypothetical protein